MLFSPFYICTVILYTSIPQLSIKRYFFPSQYYRQISIFFCRFTNLDIMHIPIAHILIKVTNHKIIKNFH